jgi:hypothetical protein
MPAAPALVVQALPAVQPIGPVSPAASVVVVAPESLASLALVAPESPASLAVVVVPESAASLAVVIDESSPAVESPLLAESPPPVVVIDESLVAPSLPPLSSPATVAPLSPPHATVVLALHPTKSASTKLARVEASKESFIEGGSFGRALARPNRRGSRASLVMAASVVVRPKRGVVRSIGESDGEEKSRRGVVQVIAIDGDGSRADSRPRIAMVGFRCRRGVESSIAVREQEPLLVGARGPIAGSSVRTQASFSRAIRGRG